MLWYNACLCITALFVFLGLSLWIKKICKLKEKEFIFANLSIHLLKVGFVFVLCLLLQKQSNWSFTLICQNPEPLILQSTNHMKCNYKFSKEQVVLFQNILSCQMLSVKFPAQNKKYLRSELLMVVNFFPFQNMMYMSALLMSVLYHNFFGNTVIRDGYWSLSMQPP